MLEYIPEENLLDFLGGKSSWLNSNNKIIEIGQWHDKGYWDALNDSLPAINYNSDLIITSSNVKLDYDN